MAKIFKCDRCGETRTHSGRDQTHTVTLRAEVEVSFNYVHTPALLQGEDVELCEACTTDLVRWCEPPPKPELRRS